jgi:hypothetical protein
MPAGHYSMLSFLQPLPLNPPFNLPFYESFTDPTLTTFYAPQHLRQSKRSFDSDDGAPDHHTLKRPKNNQISMLDFKFKRQFEDDPITDPQLETFPPLKKSHLDDTQWALVPYYGSINHEPSFISEQTPPSFSFNAFQTFLEQSPQPLLPLYKPLPLNQDDFPSLHHMASDSRALVPYSVK